MWMKKGEAIDLLYKGYDKSRDSSRYGFHPEYLDEGKNGLYKGRNKGCLKKYIRGYCL